MIIVGVTGISGSGKSTLAKKLAKNLDAEYFEIDKLNRELVTKPIIKKIVHHLKKNKISNSPYMCDIVKSAKYLPGPKITQLLKNLDMFYLNILLRQKVKESKSKILIVDYHKLQKLQIYQKCNIKILVDTPISQCIENIKIRDNYDNNQFQKQIDCGIFAPEKDYNYNKNDFDYSLNFTTSEYEKSIEKITNDILKMQEKLEKQNLKKDFKIRYLSKTEQKNKFNNKDNLLR